MILKLGMKRQGDELYKVYINHDTGQHSSPMHLMSVDWGLTSHQQLRSYGDGTSVYSPIRRTGEARDQTCDPWFTRRVT